jgi:AcrR family transcriptional regulator
MAANLDGVKNNLDGVKSSAVGYRYGVPRVKKPEPAKAPYHHGNLRKALLDAALAAIREAGITALSLRDVARRAGVSHAAPAHHFKDKAGLLTALATDGFERFAQAQRDARERGGADLLARFSWTGWAYVMFADQNREYFEIMFRPELLNRDDPAYREAANAAHQVLLETMRPAMAGLTEEQLLTQSTTAWALAHGLSRLWLDGNLSTSAGLTDIDSAARLTFGLPAKS